MPDYEDKTLALDDEHWDLHVDEYGDISIRTGAIAIAQNVANLIKLFTDDAYFDTERGLPHFDVELGKKPPYALLRSWCTRLANTVPGVRSSTANWLQFDPSTKILSGNILLTLESGETASVDLQ